jgi:hypothetical protein
MRLWRESSVLVLIEFALILAATAWLSGCAGFAEPLPQLSVTPNSLSVSTTVGGASSQVVTVANIGGATIGISQANVIGAGFSVAGLRLPLTLSPGQGANFSVKFVPSTASSVDGTLSLVTDLQHRPIVMQLHGKASPAGAPVSSVALSPASASPAVNGRVQFTATVQGTTTDHAVTWSATIGTVTSTGLYTAPATAGTGVVTATSVADPTRSASAPVTVAAAPGSNPSPNPPPPNPAVTSVTISPASATSATSGTLPFTASVQGSTSNKSVTWTASLGSITSSGLYTAPASAGTATVTAASVADPTKSASATVKVTTTPPTPLVTSVTISPNAASSTTGGTLQFTATVQGGASDKSVRWNAALGSITSSGSYTAPSQAGTDTVTAISNADSSKSSSATVNVTAQTQSGALPAFPGAQGGGAAAVGGRGGVVIEVTNLNDSGAGSLRACIDASGPRTCVFRVSGLITFLSRAQVSNPFLTIAGQTAPGGGVVIGGANQKGEQIFVSTHDVVIRYLTWDGYNPNTPTGPDTGTVCCEMASGDIYNVVWDHMTTRWGGNKAFPLVSNVPGLGIHNVTIQWSLLYEPSVTHAVGIGTVYVSSGSGLATTDDDAHHNVFINVDHRLPLNQSGRNVRWVNNLVYNWGQYAALSMGGVQTDYIGNRYVDGFGGNLNYQNVHVFMANGNGCDPHDTTGDCGGNNETGPTMYLLNNIGHIGNQHGGPMVTPTHTVNDAGQISMTVQGWEGGETGDPNSTGPWPSSWFRHTPLPTEEFPIVADPAENLDSVLLPTAGNSQHLDCSGNLASNRDSQDARVIAQYLAHASGDLFTGQFSAPAIPAGIPCQESLHDGIPDQWKQLKGLATSDPNLHNTIAPNGYTYLENYLNSTNPN